MIVDIEVVDGESTKIFRYVMTFDFEVKTEAMVLIETRDLE